jgi:predicted metal-dependent phosphoesterase TrpH
VDLAGSLGLEALAITDHDTFSGYDQALESAAASGVRLLCGIEISTAWMEPKEQTVHLLGYWLDGPRRASFAAGWTVSKRRARIGTYGWRRGSANWASTSGWKRRSAWGAT